MISLAISASMAYIAASLPLADISDPPISQTDLNSFVLPYRTRCKFGNCVRILCGSRFVMIVGLAWNKTNCKSSKGLMFLEILAKLSSSPTIWRSIAKFFVTLSASSRIFSIFSLYDGICTAFGHSCVMRLFCLILCHFTTNIINILQTRTQNLLWITESWLPFSSFANYSFLLLGSPPKTLSAEFGMPG